LRSGIHLLSYHFILKRDRTAVARVAGFSLTVRPTVFHPRYFLTSAFFAHFLSSIDLGGKRVADVGTGSGILALAAARAGAASVLALDINPNAVMAAAENAHANGFGHTIVAVGSNLLSQNARPPAKKNLPACTHRFGCHLHIDVTWSPVAWGGKVAD
jgi:release factor glutamine methyltransferase